MSSTIANADDTTEVAASVSFVVTFLSMSSCAASWTALRVDSVSLDIRSRPSLRRNPVRRVSV